MPRSSKGTKPKPLPTPTRNSEPLGAPPSASGASQRPGRSAKTKAAAAWQALQTTKKRRQQDASVESAPEAPPSKRQKPVEGPEPARASKIEAMAEAVACDLDKPPARRYAAPDIDVDHGDIDHAKSGSQSTDLGNLSGAPQRRTHDREDYDNVYEDCGLAEQPSDTDASEFHPGESSDSDEEEHEKDDLALIELERDAPALARQFSQEKPRWITAGARLTASVRSASRHLACVPTPDDSVPVTKPARWHDPGRFDASTSRRPAPKQAATPCESGYSRTRPHELVKWKHDPERQAQEGKHVSGNQTGQQPTRSKSYRQDARTYDEHISEDNDSDVDKKPGRDDSCVNDSIEIVWPEKAGKIGLKAQHGRVRAVAQQAINSLLSRVCLENAFPEGPEKHNHFAKQALMSSAEALGFDDILQRLKSDKEYAKTLGTIPAQRLSTFRGRIKAITDPLVQTAYGLECGAREHVNWLKDSLRYIYPGDYKKDTVEAQRPFARPVFVQVLRAAFFNNGRSIGTVLAQRFSSSDATRPDEKELPVPMLALVSTAIFASIADYEVDVYDAAEFSADAFADVYAENVRLLEHIKARGPKKFHALMHRLFSEIHAAHTDSKNRSRSNPIAILNLNDMEEY